jgi:protein-tyrosine phosphatase
VSHPPVRLCFVCLGNICRSPTAAAVMNHLVVEEGLDDHIVVESAGTGGWHVGEGADRRAVAEATRRGVPLPHVAQQFTADDFERFDLVLAMDDDNVSALVRHAPDAAAADRVRLLRSFDPGSPADAEVPDPWYGGPEGFREVFDLCLAACRGLIASLRADGRVP